MEQIKEIQRAIDYLDEYWPKGKSKMRGEAMVLLALAQMGGRAEAVKILEKQK